MPVARSASSYPAAYPAYRVGGARIKTTARKTVVAKAPRKALLTERHPPIAAVRPHRYRPGTRALMDIRKAQKSFEQKGVRPPVPFSTVAFDVKRLAADKLPNTRVAAGAALTAHAWVPQQIVRVLSYAYAITLNSRRITLFPRDIQTARASRDFAIIDAAGLPVSAVELPERRVTKKARSGGAGGAPILSRGAIRRLAKIAGVVRITPRIYDAVRNLYSTLLAALVNTAMTYRESRKSKTLNAADVVDATGFLGSRFYGNLAK